MNVTVVEGACVLEVAATGPTEVSAGLSVPFRASAGVSGCAQAVRFAWIWDDLVEPMLGEEVCRGFSQPGVFRWQLNATAGAATKSLTGTVTVLGAPGQEVSLQVTRSDNDIVIQWPASATGFHLESAADLTGVGWTAVSQIPQVVDGRWTVMVQASGAEQYFRLRNTP